MTETGTDTGITQDELQLAARNHGMPLEALRYDVTPVGLHYLLIHFDIPAVDPGSYRLEVGGHVRRPLALSLEELRARPAVTQAVTLECAGNGRARLQPRPVSQPWLNEAVGTAEWTGTPLRPLLEEAGILPGAVEVLFGGADRGVQGEVEHDYERSLPVAEALREEVLLAWEVNGQPLPPQHGFPLRLLVPGWYGMASVKWLRRIAVVTEPFRGYQQASTYLIQQSEDDPGVPVTRIEPRALLIPPGIPDFLTRRRFLAPGRHLLSGRAWSGRAPLARVEVSTDGGRSWRAAELGERRSRWAWAAWSLPWEATPGEHELCARATDESGATQPLEQPWNVGGMANNMVQRVAVTVR
ncbi:MAG TPA: sulfite oxidase [Actinomycetes bacterium]|jgi:DMSO/TMAO reductase YedYZ molybdopterin-dependent catalytic subunit|nr:sulfite oxidase [Actinomycetes bacterium]